MGIRVVRNARNFNNSRCFERFFKAVNTKENKLVQKRRSILMNDPDLIGMDYLWRVITNSGEEIANRAIEIMKEVSTNNSMFYLKNRVLIFKFFR